MKRAIFWHQVQVEYNQYRIMIIDWLNIGRGGPLFHQQDTNMLIWFVMM